MMKMKRNPIQIIILITCIALMYPVLTEATSCQIEIDPSQVTGEILPLLGINAGPSPIGDPKNPDITSQYQNIGVQSIRNHDIYGAHSMSILYPNRMCDPQIRDCYNFSSSDDTFAAIVNGGFQPYFRIGDGYEIVNPPAPEEYENWSDAAVHVIRHYHQGLWDGFHSNITGVEIWNEPDNIHFWPKPHTQEEFFRLYAMTAKKLKAAFPDLKIGGPGVTPACIKSEKGRQYLRSFLTYMKQHQVPLDFLSWHMYSNNPDDYTEGGLYIDSLLKEFGYENAENHLTEYNTEVKKGKADEGALALRAGSRGSAILTAAWISLQNSGVDAAYLYRGNDPSIAFPEFYGIFYANGKPKKTALAFSLWSDLVNYHTKIHLDIPDSYGFMYGLTGQDDNGNIGILVSNTNNMTQPVHFHFKNSTYTMEKGFMVSHLSDLVQEIKIKDNQMVMPPDSVLFIQMNTIDQVYHTS